MPSLLKGLSLGNRVENISLGKSEKILDMQQRFSPGSNFMQKSTRPEI
jgi:hypothetical protein